MLTDLRRVEIPNYNIQQQGYNKYHNFDSCEFTLGVDNLLLQYKHDREKITSLIINDPNKLIMTIWKHESLLAADNECRCQMGRGSIRSQFSCAQCKNLRRIIDFRQGIVNCPFKLQCGNSAGKSLIVLASEISHPFLNWDDDAMKRSKLFVEQYPNLLICGTPNVKNLRCISGDKFTIRALIMFMISKMFHDNHLPHCVMMHTAFICNGIGYGLYDMPTIGNIFDLHRLPEYHDYGALKVNVSRTIILQLLVILSELSKVNFSHGTPSIYGLIFNKTPVSYLYDEVHITGPITMQISDMWNSSATFNNSHYFSKSVKHDMNLESHMFVPEITTRSVSMAYCYNHDLIPKTGLTSGFCDPQNIPVYRLNESTLDIYTTIRHIGFPLYSGSFDFYCFMISLMCDKAFFNTVMLTPELYRLWSMMWLIEDIHDIENTISDLHNSNINAQPNNVTAVNIVFNIINHAWLRCDIIKFLWALIKAGW